MIPLENRRLENGEFPEVKETDVGKKMLGRIGCGQENAKFGRLRTRV